MKKKLNKIFSNTLRYNWSLNAFSDYEGSTYTYSDVAKHMALFHKVFEEAGIKPGDKIVLLGRNTANWAISYITIVSYGAVVVPILPDFKPDDVHYIVNHSEAVLLIASDALAKPLDTAQMKTLKTTFSLDSFEVTWERRGKKVERLLAEKRTANEGEDVTQRNIKLDEFPVNDLAVLSYTSGTTGFSKGVMISRNSLVSNIIFAQEHMPLEAGNRICSFLPMAHIYGQLFEFLFPFSLGCHTTFIDRMPSPQMVTKAFGEIKPHLILSVPLVLEKVYKKRIAPALEKGAVKFMLKVPGLNKVVYNKVKKQLTESFGGNFYEIVIGGAPMNREIEDFLRRIKFRFTIGYGMTECGPLISYDAWDSTQPYSAGRVVDRMQVKIDSDDPYNIVGEILTKGENVMLGYYKDEKSTKAAIDNEGWLHTGDLGVIDRNDYVYIRGRSKNMILGANGKNIYPEEIENRINNMPLVLESLVVERKNQLVALVFPDPDVLKNEGITADALPGKMEEMRKEVNKSLPKYEQLQKVEIQKEEFEKTPKRSIKRFMYN
ncbi:AMP-binding protein [Saccharicrinis sp. FJH54]|uniref:AMP-binding protein n=1 Tax=Saccharicrinis sp. FJH54 TaxID=3344665 RepID=UPI0035D4F22F